MFKRTLRTRSQRAYLASAIFVLILIIVLAIFGLAISKKTMKCEDFDERLRALEQLQGRKTSLNNDDFDERLHGLEQFRLQLEKR